MARPVIGTREMGRRALLATSLLVPVAARAQGKPRIVATFSILADFVRQVAGDRVEVTAIVGPETDSHAFQPTPADARKLDRKSVV